MGLAISRIAVSIFALSLPLLAQTPLSVDKLVESVRSSVKLKLPDKEVAAYLASVRLTQKLEDQTIEDLQTAGAGPRTVAALTRLADQSAKLAAPPPPPPPKPVSTGPPPPSKEVQDLVLREVREYALNYLQSLPNFLCLQVTRRSMDTHYKPGGEPSWTPIDTLAEKLSYVDHRESYELIGGKPWDKPGGALSRGEWASLMGLLFDPATETNFRWERWTSIDKKLYHVYEYSVDQAHSRESLEVDKQQRITPAYHGEIFVPHDANVVWRITVIPDIPADFPMQDVKETLKYDYVDISGQRFLLPLSSEVTMRVGRVGNHNEIDFRRYQKYSADTKLIFDESDTDIK
ncbi:MAG: hypothetical protein ABJC09_09500, partial [Terriglobia bacterium]